MNERIEPVAGLRDYYRDLARVGPADEQLAGVLAKTAGVAQRPAWQARLPKLRVIEGLGHEFPLRYGLLAAALLLVALTFGIGVGRDHGRLPGDTAMSGRWVSTDVGDGSTQTLDVGSGLNPTVRFVDLTSSGCARNGDDSVHWLSLGAALVSADRMVVDYSNGGGCHTWRVPPYTVTYLRDPATDTLQDSDGSVWHRAP